LAKCRKRYFGTCPRIHPSLNVITPEHPITISHYLCTNACFLTLTLGPTFPILPVRPLMFALTISLCQICKRMPQVWGLLACPVPPLLLHLWRCCANSASTMEGMVGLALNSNIVMGRVNQRFFLYIPHSHLRNAERLHLHV